MGIEPCCIVNISIPCFCGNLEGRLYYTPETSHTQGLVICPPHPLLAGNMDNNVLLTLAMTMAPLMPVLLFNYQAVGESSRPMPELPLYEYWHYLDANRNYSTVIQETKQVLTWIRRYFADYHLAGYSFGAWIGLQAAPENILSFTAITPPVNEHDFSRLTTMSSPLAIILAENDGLLAETRFPKLPEQSLIKTVRGSDHFFINQEKKLAALLKTFWCRV